MGLGCSDESREKYPKWCSLLDGIIGSTWAAAPDPAGVVSMGTAALDPAVAKTGILLAVRKYNHEMAKQGKDGISPTWAERNPMEALKELKRRGYYK